MTAIDEMVERRLVAILFTDIIGYTALMAESEERGLLARDRHRAIVASLIKRYGGRRLEVQGDESLSIFSAALDAVNCGLAVLDKVQAAGPRLHAGIHLGDVVLEGDDVSGDGVNIAARLCALSDGEGVFVSGEVCQAVRNHPAIGARALGPRDLKNVRRPVEVYVLRGVAGPPPQTRSKTRRVGPIAVAVAALVLTAWLWRTTILGLALDRFGVGRLPDSPPLPDGPSLVVLPFASLDPAPDDDYFAEGIAEDLTTRLVGIPELLVVSRNSASAYQAREVDVSAVGRTLGVRYVVQGSVRREGDRVRITAKLTDAGNARQIWGQRYDRVLADLFGLQSEISEEILAGLNIAVKDAELRRIRRKPTVSLTAYDTVKQANGEFVKFRRDDNAHARALYERAIEIDPRSPEALRR